MSENDNNSGPGSQRLRVLSGAAEREQERLRAANDPAGPVYEPLAPTGKRTMAAALAASAVWSVAVLWYAIA